MTPEQLPDPILAHFKNATPRERYMMWRFAWSLLLAQDKYDRKDLEKLCEVQLHKATQEIKRKEIYLPKIKRDENL